MNIKSLVLSELRDQAGIGGEIDTKTNFKELGIDSLDLIKVVVDLEIEYNIDITDKHMGKINSVDDLIACIKKLKE